MTNADHPSNHANSTPALAACIDAERGDVLTYKALDELSNQTAHWFRENGLGRGDSIVLICENSARFYEIVWAAQRIGIYYTPVSWHSTAEEIAYILADTGAKVFIASSRFSEVAIQAVALLDQDIVAVSTFAPIDEFLHLDELRQALPKTAVDNECPGREMLYTSGTTGKPKGVKFPLSESSISEAPSGDLFYKMEGYGPGAVVLAPGPSYHASPLLATLAAHRFGAAVLTVDGFDAEKLLAHIERYRVTHIACVPAHFVRLLKLPESTRSRYDISSVQWIVHTAAPCPVDIKHAMIDWFGPIIVEVYSGTERVGGALIRCDEWLAKPGSIGRPPNSVAHVLNEADWTECATGDTGVIYFETDEHFSYHGDEEKTKSVTSPQGWRTLGDIGYVDDEGYIFLTDRKSNMIISGGVNVYPQESENRLITHPKVADAAVFGIPNESFGEEVKAAIQLLDGVERSDALKQELIAYCKEVLSSLKCPRSIDFHDQLPREENGKLYKKKLIEQYR